MRSVQLPVVIMTVVATAACTPVPTLPPAPQVPEPLRAENLPPYYIQPGDVLDIRLMLNPELNEEVTVRPDGRISTTVVTDEVAAGHTVSDVANALRRDYAHDLNKPRVSVVVKSFTPTRIYVGGEVGVPGELISLSPLTLSQAVARAGGVRLSGDNGKVFIIRRTADITPQFLSVRYSDVIHAADPTADVMLAPSDVVYVPKSGIAEVYAWYNQYIQQFANPSFGFNYLVNPGAGAAAIISNPATSTTTTTVAPAAR